MQTGKVWIYLLLFFLCVCAVTDLSAEDKTFSVKFGSAVHRRPRQGITHLGNVAPPEAHKRTNAVRASGQRAGHAHPHVNITAQMRRPTYTSR